MRYHSIKKNNIVHCGNNMPYNQMMTAEVHEFWSHGRPLKYYFYISAGGLGTALE